ncbi:MAG: HYR domain-containing protein [Limisphaerales bacterium]
MSDTPVTAVLAVDGGGFHSLAIRLDGSLTSWGDDSYGQVSGMPVGTFLAVAAGGFHSVALRTDGSLVSWGSDDHQLVSHTPASGTYSTIAAGIAHTVALRTDGTLVVWGDDSFGQVGGTPSGVFSIISAGGQHNVAVRPDGSLVSWGNDTFGQVTGTPDQTVRTAAAGDFHSVAILTDGTLVSWGDDAFGQVSGTPPGTFSAVAAGAFHSLAISTDGSLVSWGDDTQGQVSFTPTAGAFTDVAAGGFHSVALINANRPPVARCRKVIVAAGDRCEAEASIDDGSFDPDDGDTLTLTQSPAGPYPLGETVVTLIATDRHGVSSECQGTVTVCDNTPPLLGPCPADRVVNAVSPAGAIVTFAEPSAFDECSAVSVTCEPPSGSRFAIGTTTVTCTAVDGAGLTSSCTFTVRVRGAAEQLAELIAMVNQLNHGKGNLRTALLAKLGALHAILHPQHRPTAGLRLEAFINLARAQRGKQLLTADQADELIRHATRVRAVLGCP